MSNTSKLWSIPVISIYLYAFTILTQYGFNSYFNIPPSFIEASIKENIVSFFSLFNLMWAIAGSLKWLPLFILILLILIIFSIFKNFHHNIFVFLVIVASGIASLVGMYHFGYFLAQHTYEFYVPVENCPLLSKDSQYIIPTFYNGQAVLVSIDDQKKMTGSILVNNLSVSGCAIKKSYTGVTSK